MGERRIDPAALKVEIGKAITAAEAKLAKERAVAERLARRPRDPQDGPWGEADTARVAVEVRRRQIKRLKRFRARSSFQEGSRCGARPVAARAALRVMAVPTTDGRLVVGELETTVWLCFACALELTRHATARLEQLRAEARERVAHVRGAFRADPCRTIQRGGDAAVVRPGIADKAEPRPVAKSRKRSRKTPPR